MYQKPYTDLRNSTVTPLGSNATFTGGWREVSAYSSVVVGCKTDRDGTLYIDFSVGKVNVYD